LGCLGPSPYGGDTVTIAPHTLRKVSPTLTLVRGGRSRYFFREGQLRFKGVVTAYLDGFPRMGRRRGMETRLHAYQSNPGRSIGRGEHPDPPHHPTSERRLGANGRESNGANYSLKCCRYAPNHSPAEGRERAQSFHALLNNTVAREKRPKNMMRINVGSTRFQVSVSGPSCPISRVLRKEGRGEKQSPR